MRLIPTKIHDCVIIEPTAIEDERGFFARTWSSREFGTSGMSTRIDECSVSYNTRRGTLRGMHYQLPPHAETKWVRCTAGSIYDVVLDLRPGPTFGTWLSCELTSANRRTLYVPEGCAHGFMSLEDASEVTYQISTPYAEESARGVRWNDPAFGISWPMAPAAISARDAAFALWERPRERDSTE